MDIGVPSDRTRFYARYNHKALLTKSDAGLAFSIMYKDKLIAMGDVYLAANERLLHGEAALYSERDGLTPAARGRLEGWRNLARRNGLMVVSDDEQPRWTQDMCVVNVQQNDAYFKKIDTDVMPALLRKSVLWDLVRERAVSVAESWLIQGVPHPDIDELDEQTRRRCPFARAISLSSSPNERCALNRQREMVGHAMHWAQISLWHLYNLSTTRLAEP